MARYQYVKDEQGQIVKAIDLVGQNVGEYICIGCDNALIAKINGKIKKPILLIRLYWSAMAKRIYTA